MKCLLSYVSTFIHLYCSSRTQTSNCNNARATTGPDSVLRTLNWSKGSCVSLPLLLDWAWGQIRSVSSKTLHCFGLTWRWKGSGFTNHISPNCMMSTCFLGSLLLSTPFSLLLSSQIFSRLIIYSSPIVGPCFFMWGKTTLSVNFSTLSPRKTVIEINSLVHLQVHAGQSTVGPSGQGSIICLWSGCTWGW